MPDSAATLTGGEPDEGPVPGNFSPRPHAETRLRARTFTPIAGSLALLLGICAAAAYLGIASQREAASAAHEEMIEQTVGALQDQLLAAESGQRGFLVTDRVSYLAPFLAAVAPIEADMDRLDTLVAGNQARTDIAHVLREHVQRKLDEMRDTISMVRGNKEAAARTLVNSDLGRRLTDEIKALVGSLQANVGEARRRAVVRRARSISMLMVSIGLAAAGAILLAALAVREVRRHLNLLQRREAQLDRLVASLEARVARRTRALLQANQRFQVALDSSRVTVFSQDRELAYDWISQPYHDMAEEQIIGRRDGDFLPAKSAAQLDRMKHGVISSGEPARAEVRIDFPAETVWQDVTLVPTTAADGTLTGLIGAAVDISERKQFESHVRLLMRELTHRSKNLLAVTQALMRQTASTSSSLEDFSPRFAARLDSLARAYDLLIKDDWRGTTMEELVRSQLAHYTDKQSSQIEITGISLRMPPDATQNIGMALHELATNAAKFGALSVPAGQVCVHWEVEGGEQGAPICRISWRETGGPLVTPPKRRGFGQVVIEHTVARAVNGRVTLAYKPTGVEWSLVFPVQRPTAVAENEAA